MTALCSGPLGFHHPDGTGRYCLACDTRIEWRVSGWVDVTDVNRCDSCGVELDDAAAGLCDRCAAEWDEADAAVHAQRDGTWD